MKIKENLSNISNTIGNKIIATVLSMQALVSSLVIKAHCDIFGDVTKLAENLFTKLYDISKALCPLAMIISAIIWLISNDEKKAQAAKHTLIGVAIAFAIIVILAKGTIVADITSLI